jgi:hypothetical protein
MAPNLRQRVWHRANGCCEYCRLPQAYSVLSFEVDHIIARQHGGKSTEGNLALTCYYCNRYKGPNLSGIDPHTGKVVSLFNPRRQQWPRHFRWRDAELIGRTACGRATIALLQINQPLLLAHREALMEDGLFPTL